MTPQANRAAVLLLLGTILTGCGDSAGLGPLSISSVSPANLAAGVALNAPIVASFSRAVQPGSAADSTVTLVTRGLSVPGSISVAGDGRTLTFSPSGGLGNNLTYQFSVHGIKDQAGAALPAPFTSTFSTVQASAAVQDPAGDTYGVASTGLVQPDVTSLTVNQDAGAIVIVMQFAQAVQPSTSGAANVVVGYIDLDADQNAATGVESATDAYRPSSGATGLGDEFAIPLFLNPDGTAPVLDLVNEVIAGNVTATFSGNVVAVRVPLALLNNDDGNVNIAAVLGTTVEPTDIVPNDGHLTLGTSGGILAGAAASRAAERAGHRAAFAGRWGNR